MPTYEYVCPKGHEFERFQRMNAGRARCPTCGRLATRRISGGAGLIFKGSGFYITDYGKDGKGARTEKETDAAAPATPAKEGEAPAPAKAEKPDPKAKSPKKKAES